MLIVPKLEAEFELRIDRGDRAQVFVNGSPCFSHIVSPNICSRVAILAWGDHDDYRVDVTELSLKTRRKN